MTKKLSIGWWAREVPIWTNIPGERLNVLTGKRDLFPNWGYGLESGWTFKIVN